MNPGTTIEQDERDDGYFEYIISKSYYNSSRKKNIIDLMSSLMI